MAKQDSKTPDAQSQPEVGKIARLRAAIGAKLGRWPKRVLIVAAIAAFLVGAHFVALVIWFPRFQSSQQPVTLQMALAALDRKSYSEAKHFAAALEKSPDADARDRAGASFVLGAAEAEEVDLLPPANNRGVYQSAAKHLEDAHARGFPEGRRAQGLLLLGKSLCRSDQFAAGRAILEEALKTGSSPNPEVYYLLASAYFHGDDPDLKKAQQQVDYYLSETTLTADRRSEGTLLDAQILDQLGDPAGCEAALAQIPPTASVYPSALMLEGTLLMRRAQSQIRDAGQDAVLRDAAVDTYRQAIETFNAVAKRGESTPALAMRAAYWAAVCQMQSGDEALAIAGFDRLIAQNLKSQEGIAAAFQVADLLRRNGKDEEALGRYRQAIQAIGDAQTYRNELLPIEIVRKQLLAAYEQYLRSARIETAMTLSRLLHPLFPGEREFELKAELLRATAKTYFAKADAATPEQAAILRAKGRLNLRQAGVAFNKLAELHVAGRTYTDDLWNASECYLAGQDYKHAAETLKEYLKNEVRRRRATALLMLGRAELSGGNVDSAIAALDDCVKNYPADPVSFEARLLAAKALIEKGENDKAEPLLRANLENSNLTPRSTEWRDSLFLLGQLLQESGNASDAVRTLEEAIERYPTAPQAIEARYLAAEAHRRLGAVARDKRNADEVESVRTTHDQQMRGELETALAQYQQLETMLTDEKHDAANTPLNQSILRNSYFSQAAALASLGRYEDAIQMYSSIASRYRNEPEVLEALVQSADCYRHLDRPQEARSAVLQAQAALERISKDADFRRTTNYTREEWTQLLNRMAAA
jgi:TolA-binding protein